MDDKRNRPRHKERSRGRGGGRPNRPPDGRGPKRRNDGGRERDGNVAPKNDDMRLGRCFNCKGPAPDKADLCRHCASMPKPPEPTETPLEPTETPEDDSTGDTA